MKTIQNLMMPVFVLVLLGISSIELSAQENIPHTDDIVVPEGYELVDSLVYRFVSAVDTSLVGKDIFHAMPLKVKGDAADIEIYQSQEIANALRNQVSTNRKRAINGFRVRIFFDNKQTARKESEAVFKRFCSLCHDVKAYRTYVNPYFKVTVGDFRTKSEAMELLSRIKPQFPSAFVVKESIEYPVVDKDNVYVIDTVKVLRPIQVDVER